MASYTPPTEYLPIFDNAVFTTIGIGTGLTETKANLLYLKKTVPDIATALETFTGGIKTDSIDTTTTSTNLAIGNAVNAGAITIDTTRNITIGDAQVGAGYVLALGNKNSRIGNINIGSGATTSSQINILSGTNSTGIINLGAGNGAFQTTTTNIGSGGTSAINVASSVNIGSGFTNAPVTIGNPLNNVNINGTLTMGVGRNIVLQSSPFIVPTSFLQLGSQNTQTSNITTITQGNAAGTGASVTLLFKQITTAGVYVINSMTQVDWATTAPLYFYTNIYESTLLPVVNTTTNIGSGINSANYGMQSLGTINSKNYIASSGSMIFTVTEAKKNNYYNFGINIYTTGTLGIIYNSLDIVRIA